MAKAKAVPDFDEVLDRAGPPRPQYLVERRIATLDEAQRAKVLAALRDPEVGSRRITRALRAIGLEVSDAAVYNYRKALNEGRLVQETADAC